MRGVLRAVVLLVAGVLVLSGLAGCSWLGEASSPGPAAAGGGDERSLTVGGADFTEMRIMQQLYGKLLQEAGFQVSYRTSKNREAYVPELESGVVDVVPEYAATMTEYLNHEQNGADARVVATGDAATTVALMRPLARWKGLDVLTPAAAADQNGFAVPRDFARKNKLTTLSQLAALGDPVVLAATPECAQRVFCQRGLERAYGLRIAKILPLGFGTAEAKRAVLDGEAQVALVGTTDGTLPALQLRLLRDDRRLQLADNLVPVVNRESAGGPKVAAALNRLAPVLTTNELAAMNELVDGERRPPEQVAQDFLERTGLLRP
jgi:osmoprotectant transport system substrate-binding protein